MLAIAESWFLEQFTPDLWDKVREMLASIADSEEVAAAGGKVRVSKSQIDDLRDLVAAANGPAEDPTPESA